MDDLRDSKIHKRSSEWLYMQENGQIRLKLENFIRDFF